MIDMTAITLMDAIGVCWWLMLVFGFGAIAVAASIYIYWRIQEFLVHREIWARGLQLYALEKDKKIKILR